MKIEVGDKIRNDATGNLGIVTEVKGLNVFFERCKDGTECVATVNFVTIIEKGEKKMKYRGIEAYKALQDGKVLALGVNGERLYKMIESQNYNIYEQVKGERHWSPCKMELNFFMSRAFVEYKEPLKYKVGDEVWVKAKVIKIDEGDIDGLVYKITREEWKTEEDVKGIDE